MNPVSIAGAVIVTMSLLAYGIGSITLQRFKMISPGILWFLSLGVLFDITATGFMIVGSSNTPFTLHGLLGYSALIIMLVDVILIWKLYLKEKTNAKANNQLLLYSKIAYAWWVIVYITGSLLIIWK